MKDWIIFKYSFKNKEVHNKIDRYWNPNSIKQIEEVKGS